MTNIIPHPAFLLNLPFLIAMPNTQKLIKEIKTEVLKWDNTSAGVHKMGGIGFYYNEREFAHIHWNGDLDIIFGSKLTSELLKNNHAQFHKYVPTIAVTFKLKNISETPSAIFLLSLTWKWNWASYLLIHPLLG